MSDIYNEPLASSSEKYYEDEKKLFRKNLVEKDTKVCDDCGEIHGKEAYPFEGAYTGLKKDNDMVNHPEHYNKGKYETYDVIVDTLGKHEAISYCQGNILKYIMRMWNKDKPLQDAEKAEWYLKAMIKLLKETKGVNW